MVKKGWHSRKTFAYNANMIDRYGKGRIMKMVVRYWQLLFLTLLPVQVILMNGRMMKMVNRYARSLRKLNYEKCIYKERVG